MEEFYTVDEVAEMLKVTRKTVYDWMREGRLEYTQVGQRRRRVTKTALERFVRAYSVDTSSKMKKSDDIRKPGLGAIALSTP